jgi:cell wall-associated NlpC family hydrolase
MRRPRLATVLLLGSASPLAAQGPGFSLARLFTDPGANAYRLDASAPVAGPVRIGPHAILINGDPPMGNLWGAGLDLSLFQGGRPGFYLIGGVDGGFVSQGRRTFWGSWSAGLGYEVFPFGGLSLAAEGRYRKIAPDHYGGVQFGVRLALEHSSRRSAEPATAGMTETAAWADSGSPKALPDTGAVRSELSGNGVPEDRAQLISGVVQTALDVMGMPYRWGDEGESGFDCSGLIRYAFGRHGVSLPRRSAEQAREGAPIEKRMEVMQAGDILTFSTAGRGISHVGLYLGDGRFIHSARQGVQISVLSPDDVSGRWWYRRWVGVRRIVM